MPDVHLCKHCGEAVDLSRSICDNCGHALTKYGGQVGMQEEFDRKLQGQVDQLSGRPLWVTWMTVMLLLSVLMWPVRSVLQAWGGFEHSSAGGGQYMVHAVSILIPLFDTALLVPVAVLLLLLARLVWMQQALGWRAAPAALAVCLFAVGAVWGWGLGAVWAAGALVCLVMWFQNTVRAWYGLN